MSEGLQPHILVIDDDSVIPERNAELVVELGP